MMGRFGSMGGALSNILAKKKALATSKQDMLGNQSSPQLGMPTPKLGTAFTPPKQPPMPNVGGMFGGVQQSLLPGQVGKFDLYGGAGPAPQNPRDSFLDSITNRVNAGAQTQGLLAGMGRGIAGLSK